MTSKATKREVKAAIKTINRVFGDGEDVAQLIDWSSCGDGYAIGTHWDAIHISGNDRVMAALPAGLWLEPINNGALRLYRN